MDSIIKSIEGTKIRVRTADGGYKVFDIIDLFKIDDTNLSKEMAQQASIYGYFTVLATMAEDVAAKATFQKEVDEASANLAYRDQAAKDGTKTTEGSINAMVTADEAHVKKCELELITKFDHKLLKAIVATLDQRANMLISLGAWLRHEQDQTSMHTNEKQLGKAVDDVKAVMNERKARKLVK